MYRRCRLAVAAALMALAAASQVGCGRQPVAIVGQHQITRQELLDRLEEEGGRQVLLGMIDRKLIEDAFAASGMALNQEDVQKRMQEIRDSVGSAERFARELAARGLTEQQFAEDIAFELKVKALLTKDVKVTEPELRKFFETEGWRLDQPPQVTYSEIVVPTETEAKKVMAELKKPNASFSNLAKQFSISPVSRQNGGRLPPIDPSRIEPRAIREALQPLKPGDIAGPIQVDQQWYILKLENRTERRKADFNRDRAKIEDLYKQARSKRPDELLSELRQKANIRIVDPKYADLNDILRPPQMPQFGTQPGGKAQQGDVTPPPGGQRPEGGSSQPPAGKTKGGK